MHLSNNECLFFGFQRKLKRSAKNCIGLGDYFSKHTKKTAEPQEEVELLKENEDEEVQLLEENEDDSKIPGQSSPPKNLVMSKTYEAILKINTVN